AQVAACRDASSVFWNPAGLTYLELPKGEHYEAVIGQINMPADIQLNTFVIARKLGVQAVSLHVINLYTGDMKVRTYEKPEGTGENFNAYDFIIGGSYARKLTDKFSLGGNVRYLRSGLENSTYNGVSVDLGTLYQTGLRSLTLGMAIQNLGPNVTYSGSYWDYRNATKSGGIFELGYEDAALPTMFRLGVAANVFEMLNVRPGDKHDATLSVEMNHPNDNRERLNIGGEYVWNKILALRLGGKFAYDTESFSAGFGLRVPIAENLRFTFDYAYSHYGDITAAVDEFMMQPHRFSLGFAW
ncbi:MAG: PorV/PorQ family protein, partial [Calditrichaeota bacterium]|nr:PorV/PorQ family protein [Calditrichota bacterium]